MRAGSALRGRKPEGVVIETVRLPSSTYRCEQLTQAVTSSPASIWPTAVCGIVTSGVERSPSPQSMRIGPMCSAHVCGTAKNSMVTGSFLGQMTVKTKGSWTVMREADMVLG